MRATILHISFADQLRCNRVDWLVSQASSLLRLFSAYFAEEEDA